MLVFYIKFGIGFTEYYYRDRKFTCLHAFSTLDYLHSVQWYYFKTEIWSFNYNITTLKSLPYTK